MAAGSFTFYSSAILELTKGQINLASDTFVAVLVSNSYTPTPNTDAQWSAVSANELATGSGYTAGGVVLTSVSDTLTSGTVTWTAAAASWASFSATFKYVVIVHRAGASLASTDLLVAYCDCNSGGGTVTGGGGTLTITPNASGIGQFTHSP